MGNSSDFWDEKPSWCQPWTIVLTGTLLVLLSWFLFHIIWVSIVFCVGVGAWWTLFLILVPKNYIDESD